MAINAGAFVKPAFLHRSVGSDDQQIGFAVKDVVRQIVAEAGIAAVFGADVVAVEPDR